MARCTRFVSGLFSPGTPVSSTNKTDRHDIKEILLKVALNTTNKTYIFRWIFPYKFIVIWTCFPFIYQFHDGIFLHVPISWQNIAFIYQFRGGIFSSCTNFVIEYSLLSISWQYSLDVSILLRNIPFMYQFGDGIFSSSTNFVTEYYILFLHLTFRSSILGFIYIYMCAFLRYICYWYSMRILCHCTDIYNNDACHFVLYILKSTTYTAIFTLLYPSKMFF